MYPLVHLSVPCSIRFMNDLPELLGGASKILVDNVKLLSETGDVKDQQVNLDYLSSWTVPMDLYFSSPKFQQFHVDKFQALQFRAGRRHSKDASDT